MKTFKTDPITGIIPVVLNDLRFMETASTEMIEALVTMLSELTTYNSFILTGVVSSGVPTVISAGWVVLNGKIYKVKAQSYPAIQQGNSTVFRIQENVFPGGNKQMKPGLTQVDTFYEYTAVVISTANVLPGDVLWGLNRFEKIIQDINPITSNWVNITLESGWEGDTTNDRSVPQYKLHHNVVYMRGYAVKTGASTLVATLPVAIQPPFLYVTQNLTSIKPDGDVNTLEDFVCFDGIVYFNN